MPRAMSKSEKPTRARKRDKLDLFNDDTLEVVRLARVVHNTRSQTAIDSLAHAVADLEEAGKRRRANLQDRIAEREEVKRSNRTEAERIAAEEAANEARLAAAAQAAAETEEAAIEAQRLAAEREANPE